jgi:AcrR family transcriptional regulator
LVRSLKTRRPYHHGALREALLGAAERILDEKGARGLTLRAAARETGASHAAPKNHFGDLSGLLSELAAVGYRRFSARLLAAANLPEHTPPAARLASIGHAYVDFAVEFPGLFQLMFRSDRLDVNRPALRESMEAATAILADAVGGIGAAGPTATLTLHKAGRMLSAWSIVHGYSMLLLDGRLSRILARLPDGTSASALLDATLSPLEPGGADAH